MSMSLTSEREVVEQAGLLGRRGEALHLADVEALVLQGGVGQQQLHGDVAALHPERRGLGQRQEGPGQGAAGLGGREGLGLWAAGHVCHPVPGQVAVEQPVCCALQSHVVLLDGLG